MRWSLKKRRIILIIFTFFIILWGVIAILPRQDSFTGSNPLMKNPQGRPLLIAHGGGNGEFPDNTLEAFYNAYSVDPHVMMETDVSITKDGVIILSHDTTLDRKTNLTYADISEINYVDLISDEVDFSYDNNVVPNSNGYNVSGELIKYQSFAGNTVTPLDVNYPEGINPRHHEVFLATTLEELIIAFPNNRINVEIKQEKEIGLKALDAVIKLMEDLDGEYNTFERMVLASFHKEVFQELEERHKTNPKLMYSPAVAGVVKYYIMHVLAVDALYNDNVAALQIPMKQMGINLATKGLVRTAHRHNIAVHYWTIDDEEDMRKLINIGADGIMTNLPTKLKKVYDEEFTK